MRIEVRKTVSLILKMKLLKNKMIVISDGDVGRNQIMKGQNLPLGADFLPTNSTGNRTIFEKLS